MDHKLDDYMDNKMAHQIGTPNGPLTLAHFWSEGHLECLSWWSQVGGAFFFTILCALVAGPVESTANLGPPNRPLNLAEQWPADFMIGGPTKWANNCTTN